MSSVSKAPEPLALIARDMAGFPGWWALCGGWAVDSWLGRVTRDHGDLDITVFADDAPALYEFLEGWNHIAHDEVEPTATEQWDGRALVLPAHLHSRPPGERNAELLHGWVTPPHQGGKDGRDIEFVINRGTLAGWLLSADPRIEVSLDWATRQSPWGLPTVVPEVIAFFKATAYFGHKRLWNRPHDITDFDALVGLLDRDRRAWLRESIAVIHPEHPWLDKI